MPETLPQIGIKIGGPTTSQHVGIVDPSTPALYCLTLVLIAPRVMMSGVKLR
jgi:hypothetical protein